MLQYSLLRKRNYRPLQFLLLMIFILQFSNCDLNGTDNSDYPEGSWSSGSDSYEISATILNYDDGSNGQWGMSYSGKIHHKSRFNDKAGVLIIEYTEPPAFAVGNFIGIYYRDLSKDTVKLANPYDPEGTETSTLADALQKFTKANEGKMVNWSIVQTQKRK